METASSYEAGITRLSTFALTSERADPESTVFLSSGDMWQGSADSNLTYGQLMVNWMNIAGFESMAIGNHEFDWGYTHIVENAALANFPFLGINIVDPQGLRPSWAQPSKVVVRGGYKIGVIGAIGKLEGSIAVSSLGGFSFRSDYADLVRQEADRLRQEEDCSLVVLSIHNGSFDTTYCHNIDAVFEGHSHSNYKTTDSFNIPHVQTYANGSDFQHVRFSLVDGKFVFDSYSTVAFSTLSALDEEPMSLGVFGYYDGKNSAIKNEVVGHTTSLLDESTLANYSVQCMVPGYTIALALTFLVPKIYTSIAFDSGGVASGPMASTFVMPFAIGFAYASHPGNDTAVYSDAFGCVSMFIREVKREHQAMGLSIERKPFEFWKKKKSEDSSSSPHKPNGP